MVLRELYRQTIHQFISIDKLHRSHIDKSMQEMGILRNQHMLLMYIAHSEKPLCQKEMAEKFKITPAAVTNALQNLEKSNLIEKIVDNEDTRKNKITLTQKGEDMIKVTEEKFDYVDSKMFSGFSKEEIYNLEKYLDRILDNLKEGENCNEKMV